MTHMQFALPLTLSDEPSLANFIVGSNVEAVMQCERIALGQFEHTALYLWGGSGVGKTHLLSSLRTFPCTQVLTSSLLLDEPVLDTLTRVYLIDDVHLLDAIAQQNLFHLYNQVRTNSKIMVLMANCAPAQLSVDFLPDLRTRLGWDLVYQLHPLTDENKAQVLYSQAEQRGLTLGSGVVTYMLHHLTRDLSQLHRFLQHLDEYSLQKKRALTLPLLREWLENDSSE